MERLSGCPCVVRLHEAALTGPPGAPTAAFALMDFCPDTLVGFLQQRGWRLEDAELLRVALPVARAVQAMHSLSPPLAHRCEGMGEGCCAGLPGIRLGPHQHDRQYAWQRMSTATRLPPNE